MRLDKVKSEITELYKKNNINEKSEIAWLFSHVLKIKPSELITIKKISIIKYIKIRYISNIRIKGKPLAKIIKKVNFYGYDFYINKNVLTPRKETELLVEKVIKDYKTKNNKKILDLCSGSGIIAHTLNKELRVNIFSSDLCKKTIKVSKKNGKILDSKIRYFQGDLFDNINEKFNAIVSNPPYIDQSDIDGLEKEVKRHDPIIALDGGEGGLYYYKKIIKIAPHYLLKNGKLYIEIGKDQLPLIIMLMKKSFINIKVIKDYSNIDRVIVGTKK